MDLGINGFKFEDLFKKKDNVLDNASTGDSSSIFSSSFDSKSKFNVEECEDELAELYDKLTETDNSEERKFLNSQSNLPDEVKDNLSELYDELSEATDDAEREMILAKIDAVAAAANIDSKEEQEILMQQKLNAMNGSYDKQLAQTYEMLSHVTDYGERYQIKAEIDKLEVERTQETSKIKRDILSLQSNLPDEVKDKFSGLFDELSEATDDAERDRILAEINALAAANIDSKEEQEIFLQQKINAMNVSYDKQLAKNYEMLSQTTDNYARQKIMYDINQITMDFEKELDALNLELFKTR